MKFNLRLLLIWLVKVTGVIVTAPATYAAAATFAEQYRTGTELIAFGWNFGDIMATGVELAAMLLVEGVFLLSWVLIDIDTDDDGNASVANIAFAWGMYGVIMTIGAFSGRAEAVIIRLPILAMLLWQTSHVVAGWGRWVLDKLDTNRDVATDVNVPMSVRIHNAWHDAREAMLARRTKFKAFRETEPIRKEVYQKSYSSSLAVEDQRIERAAELELQHVNEEFNTELLGETDITTGERTYDGEQALAYLKRNGLARSDGWLRQQAIGQKSENWLAHKIGRSWQYTQSGLDTLLDMHLT